MDPPCAVCTHPVTDECEAIGCDGCGNWQHRKCNTGFTLAQYRRMVKGLIDLPFWCVQCKEDPVELMEVTHTRDEASSDVEMETDYVPQDCSGTSDSLSGESAQGDQSLLSEPNVSVSFHIDASFEEPVPVVERSLNDPSPTDTFVEERPVQYEVLQGASQRGRDLLVDNIGYSYTIKETNGSSVVWWCSVRNKTTHCPARVRQIDSNFKPGRKEHVHPPDPTRKAKITITKQAISIGNIDVFKSALTIVEQISIDTATPTDIEKPSNELIARNVNRNRQKTRPQEPKDMDFQLNFNHFPKGFFKKEVNVEGRRHLIFATDDQLKLLQNANRWYLDGTFKVVKEPFTSLLSIHSFVRRGECAKQIPLVFVMMSGRRTVDYVKVLQAVGRMLNRCVSVVDFVVDFERALWDAIRTVFTGAEIHGCAFHWSQAVFRQVQNKGLVTEYMAKKGTYAFLRKVLCLPYLPAEHIVPVFELLFNQASDNLLPIMMYVRRTWIQSTVWPVDCWSVYGHSIRTNNDVEGWHRRLNHRAGDGTPPFYLLIRLLYGEATTAVHNAELVSDLRLRRYQRRQYARVQGRTFELWKRYSSGRLSATGLLKPLSCIFKPAVPVSSVD